jgi:hypothetical protein
MWKNLSVAAAAALVVGVVTVSCSGGSKDLCVERNVSCDAPLLCDPTDGVCKCGGRGGVSCPSGFACDATSNTCLSTLCAHVDCSDQPGTSCDVTDGSCKCGGTGGVVCGSGQTCDGNARACVRTSRCEDVGCSKNQTCDATTGQCLCGQATCTATQACVSSGAAGAKSCVADLCSGVACTGGTACDSADGQCKCGGAVCQAGQACQCTTGDGGTCADADRACRAGSACASAACANGTTCDPVDGQCKCGGPGGPACGSNQLCALSQANGPQCIGGQQCTQPDGGAKTCAGGTSCDPEDGRCKCGGRGGIACAPAATDGGTAQAEVCVQNPSQQACHRPCDIRNSDCPTGTFCFFDSSASTPVAYCAAATDTRVEGSACTSPTACFAADRGVALHCLGLALGQTGICEAYCDVAAGTTGCVQVPRAQVCTQISNAPAGYGYCLPQ